MLVHPSGFAYRISAVVRRDFGSAFLWFLLGVCGFTASGQAQMAPVVAQAVVIPTTTSASASPEPSMLAQSVTFSANVTTSSASVGVGTVVVSEGRTILCSASIRAGQAACSSSALTIGSHSIVVEYIPPADSGIAPSSVVITHIVTALSFNAASIKTHASVGTYAIVIAQGIGPSSDAITVEPRSSEGGIHRLVFLFPFKVSSVNVQLASGPGSALPTGVAGAPDISASGQVVTVPLRDVPDRKRLVVGLTNINGVPSATAAVSIGFLFGDVTQDRQVTGLDGAYVGASSPAAVNGTNFKFNVSLSGAINALDKALATASAPKALETVGNIIIGAPPG